MEISRLRKQINEIDRNIVDILNKRAKLILDVGRIKRKKRQPVYVPEREKEVYDKITKVNHGPLKDDALKAIYREIMSSAISLEEPIKIAYLGPPATFSHIAAMQKFGSQVSYVDCKSISDVFNDVEKGNADYGVVPIENSIEGAVNHTLDMFVDAGLNICSEVSLEIKHNLLANCRKERIKTVYSIPQVFGQCRLWLESNMHKADLAEVSSTTRAAEIAASEKFSAAIASELAAACYGLKIIARSIEDSPHNVTRFLVVGNIMARPTGKDKTSIMFSIKDRVGALHDMLMPFKKYRINLTKIESRPSKRKPWEYYFFVDMEGHIEDKYIKSAVCELEKNCSYLKVLGSYPVSD